MKRQWTPLGVIAVIFAVVAVVVFVIEVLTGVAL